MHLVNVAQEFENKVIELASGGTPQERRAEPREGRRGGR